MQKRDDGLSRRTALNSTNRQDKPLFKPEILLLHVSCSFMVHKKQINLSLGSDTDALSFLHLPPKSGLMSGNV